MKFNLFLFRFHCWPGLQARANTDTALAAAHLYLHWEQALVLTVPKIAPSPMSVTPLVPIESYRMI